jgi:hypothetical protein
MRFPFPENQWFFVKNLTQNHWFSVKFLTQNQWFLKNKKQGEESRGELK